MINVEVTLPATKSAAEMVIKPKAIAAGGTSDIYRVDSKSSRPQVAKIGRGIYNDLSVINSQLGENLSHQDLESFDVLEYISSQPNFRNDPVAVTENFIVGLDRHSTGFYSRTIREGVSSFLAAGLSQKDGYKRILGARGIRFVRDNSIKTGDDILPVLIFDDYGKHETLGGIMKTDHDMPLPDRLGQAQWFIDEMTYVTGDMDIAHRHNIIHRDMKPENLIIKDGRIYVADFGLAVLFDHTLGEAFGTEAYIAAEQAVNSKNATARSDQYSNMAIAAEFFVRNGHNNKNRPAAPFRRLREPINPQYTMDIAQNAVSISGSELVPEYPDLLIQKLGMDERPALVISAILAKGMQRIPDDRHDDPVAAFYALKLLFKNLVHTKNGVVLNNLGLRQDLKAILTPAGIDVNTLPLINVNSLPTRSQDKRAYGFAQVYSDKLIAAISGR